MKIILLLLFTLISLFCFSQEDSLITTTLANKYNLTIGGALRLNYNLSTWKKNQVKRGGDFGFDLFRINVNAEHKGVTLNAEYRLYSAGFGGGMLKQGWFGYNLKNNKSHFELGLTQVPFGNQQYNSNNWFFNLPYYVGLEDDHDMGIKFVHETEKINLHIAFFKNAEELVFGDNSSISPNRYSYDVAGRNKEVNQGNVKLDFKMGKKKNIMISPFGEYGGLYNVKTEKYGNHSAFGLAMNGDFNKLNLKLQGVSYQNNPNDSSAYKNTIEMAAYGAPYEVAAKGQIYTAGIAYNIDLDWGPITKLTLYNDFAFFDKTNNGFEDSFMNVFGGMFTAGKVYTYVDFASAKNHSWIGPNWNSAFSTGASDAKWETRFNISFGYYF